MITRSRLFMSPLLLATTVAIAVSGCATKGFVRNYVESQVAPQRETTTRLQTELTAVKTTADSADAHASAAQLMARNAFDEAAASRRLASKIASGDLTYKVVQTQQIHFGYDKFTLDHPGRQTLDQVAGMLDQHPRWILEIMGATDRAGSPRYNLRLGQERAETVRRYLNDEHKIPLSKMATISYGAGRPVAHGEGKAAESRNRRAEIRVLEVQDEDLVSMTGSPEGTPVH